MSEEMRNIEALEARDESRRQTKELRESHAELLAALKAMYEDTEDCYEVAGAAIAKAETLYTVPGEDFTAIAEAEKLK